jgi:diguanylate cyclase
LLAFQAHQRESGLRMAISKTSCVVCVSTAACIAFATWVLTGWGGESTVRFVTNIGSVGFASFAAVCAAVAARSTHGRQRGAWIAFAIGFGAWALGAAVWMYYVWGLEQNPFPSPADAGFLVYPIAACVGLALFPEGYSGQSRTRLVLEGFIAAAALFEVSWVLVLRTVYEAGGASRFAVGLSMAYPVADVVLISVALLVFARARTGQRTVLTLLASGIVLMALSDSAFSYLSAHGEYKNGSVVDVGWVVAFLLFGIAALVGRGARSSDVAAAWVPSARSQALLFVPLFVAAVVCTIDFLPTPGLGPLLVASILLVFAVVARQSMVVGENRRLLDIVAEQALRDTLTGLANRSLFNDRLEHAMQLHERDGQSVTVLSLDLDDFKLVNDSMGHHAGDTLLILVAERLVDCVRPGDTVARLGGDEFAVLMEGTAEYSSLVAHRVVQAFDETFVIDGHDVLVRPSSGLAVVSDNDPGISADELLKRADVAMYTAKRSRSAGVQAFTPRMKLIDAADLGAVNSDAGRGGLAAVNFLGELRHAIDRGDLALVYQPKFDLRTAEIVGVEALVRWPHPERGLLGPEHFLPLVRQNGLMGAVTELVLARALDDVAAWSSQGVQTTVAVNISAPSLGDLHLPNRISQLLADRELRPDCLTVEITEDLLLDNTVGSRDTLNRLRESGIRIAIDDFGSGYSALWYLRDLPIDELKLDKEFIAPVVDDPRAASIVRAVIALAHELNVTTVAEGVENADTADRLREYDCDLVQGFYYSRPVSAAAVAEMLSSSMSPAGSC